MRTAITVLLGTAFLAALLTSAGSLLLLARSGWSNADTNLTSTSEQSTATAGDGRRLEEIPSDNPEKDLGREVEVTLDLLSKYPTDPDKRKARLNDTTELLMNAIERKIRASESPDLIGLSIESTIKAARQLNSELRWGLTMVGPTRETAIVLPPDTPATTEATGRRLGQEGPP